MEKTQHQFEEGDINLIEHWIQFKPKRIVAGVLAGLFSGVLALVVAGVLSKVGGKEFLYPIKVAALPLVGAQALEFGLNIGTIIVGLLTHLVLASVLGAVYAHFTVTNLLLPLIGAGFTWGAFSWIFIQNLFIQSFQDIFAAKIPSGPAFLVCMVFGFGLVSVRFFDCSSKKA